MTLLGGGITEIFSGLKITVFCSDHRHHSWSAFAGWAREHDARITDDAAELVGGDLLLLVSCTQFIGRETREKYRSVFVVHESSLPEGRGWSPMAWQILEGRRKFTVSLIEAEDEIDAGGVLATESFELQGHELSDEINAARDAARCRLMSLAIDKIGAAGTPQEGPITYYPRRTPADSRIDPEMSISAQFDLLRICEPRFPAFFDLRGHRYEIALRKSA